jgi:hypothetical protein
VEDVMLVEDVENIQAHIDAGGGCCACGHHWEQDEGGWYLAHGFRCLFVKARNYYNM